MKYSPDHTWAYLLDDGTIRAGLTTFALSELGEISFIELPQTGDAFAAGDPVCSVDSLKSTSDIYAPVSGVITKVNDRLNGDDGLDLLNKNPEGEGWVFVLKPKSAADYEILLDSADYKKLTGG